MIKYFEDFWDEMKQWKEQLSLHKRSFHILDTKTFMAYCPTCSRRRFVASKVLPICKICIREMKVLELEKEAVREAVMSKEIVYHFGDLDMSELDDMLTEVKREIRKR